MEKWKSKYEPALDLKSDPEQFVNEVLIEGNKVCEQHANQKYMFSEVIYSEEFGYDKMQFGCNRMYDMKFFEICLSNDEHIFRAAHSLEEIEAKFNNFGYKWIKSCTQECYDIGREKESWKGDVFVDG